MKTCVVFGDLSSDSATDQYPTIQICDDCLENYDSEYIQNTVDFNPMYGDSCEFCPKTKKEEEQEQS